MMLNKRTNSVHCFMTISVMCRKFKLFNSQSEMNYKFVFLLTLTLQLKMTQSFCDSQHYAKFLC